MDFDLKPNDYISVVSAVVAAIAAGFAFVSSKHAKRQADAVLGNVSASFSAYQDDYKTGEYAARVRFEIVNHNRKPLLVHKIWLEYKGDVEVLKHHKETVSLLDDIIRRADTGDASYIFDIPHRLRGCGANSDLDQAILKFRARWKEDRTPFYLYFGSIWSFEGDKAHSFSYARMHVIPPSY